MNITASEEAIALAPAFTVFAEENFLLTLTNRGVYNRSRKDSEALTDPVALFVEEGRLAVSFGDVKVLLDNNIAQSRCTCPSGNTCRHVLIALFAAQELVRRGGAGKIVFENAESADFSELEEITLGTLKKEGGKKNYEAAVNFMSEACEVKFTHSELLAAHIAAFDTTVYFPRQRSVSASVCKCGEKGLCLHRVIAILAFLTERGLVDMEAEKAAEISASSVSREALLPLLESAKGYTVSLFEKGLISADETDIAGAQQFSLKLDGAGVGNLSRLFRGIATDIENMRAKNIAFEPLRSFSSLACLYTTLSLLLAHPGDTEIWDILIEKSRSVYRTLPLGHFTGLGAYPWQTRSGYAGVTVLIYHKEKNAVRSYTVSIADFYEGTQNSTNFHGLNSLLYRSTHWDAELSLHVISRNCFTLRSFKVSEEGRLSTSKVTRYSSQGKTSLAQIEEISAAVPAIAGDVSGDDYFGRKNERRYRFVWAKGIRDCVYDRVRQCLLFTLDTADGEVSAFIGYSEITKRAIEFIENLTRTDFSPCCFVGEIERQGFIPLSRITEAGVENFYFSDRNGGCT